MKKLLIFGLGLALAVLSTQAHAAWTAYYNAAPYLPCLCSDALGLQPNAVFTNISNPTTPTSPTGYAWFGNPSQNNPSINVPVSALNIGTGKIRFSLLDTGATSNVFDMVRVLNAQSITQLRITYNSWSDTVSVSFNGLVVMTSGAIAVNTTHSIVVDYTTSGGTLTIDSVVAATTSTVLNMTGAATVYALGSPTQGSVPGYTSLYFGPLGFASATGDSFPPSIPSPTITPTNSPVYSPTPTFSVTKTITLTWTRTATPTNTPKVTATPTATPSNSPAYSKTITPDFSPTATFTPTSTPSATRTATPTASPTATPSNSPVYSATSTKTVTMTFTVSPTFTVTPLPTQPVPFNYYASGQLQNVIAYPNQTASQVAPNTAWYAVTNPAGQQPCAFILAVPTAGVRAQYWIGAASATPVVYGADLAPGSSTGWISSRPGDALWTKDSTTTTVSRTAQAGWNR